MRRLSEARGGSAYLIEKIEGDTRFVSRVTAMGLTERSKVDIIQNGGGTPVLLFARDTSVAISKREAKNIFIQEFAR